MTLPTLVYLHGLNSSPASHKARQLDTVMQRLGLEQQLHIPALGHEPRHAIEQLETLVSSLDQPLLVGSSLGGYYATWLAQRHRLKAILVNPAVAPYRLFERYLGPQQNYYTGEQWVLDEQHVAQLAALDVPPPKDASRFKVWLQTGDETLDYRDAVDYYQGCDLLVEPGGDHGFQHFARHIPEILTFAGFSKEHWQAIDFSEFD